jgi:hypothetical protein
MSPRSPSSSIRSERRMPSSDTSTRPVSRTGIWTRRPSVVRATTTWRRSRPSNRANAYSVCGLGCWSSEVPRSLSVERLASTRHRRSGGSSGDGPTSKRDDRRMKSDGRPRSFRSGRDLGQITSSGVRRWVPSPCPHPSRRRCRGSPTSSGPLDASAKTHGHRREERQCHSEARQVRPHFNYLVLRVPHLRIGSRAVWLLVSGPDPWLCVPVSRRVCPGRLR